MKTQPFVKIFGLVLASALLLGGCRAEEQDRVLMYKPGTYLGKKDTQLGESRLNQLRERVIYQGGGMLSDGGAAKGSDVRLPGE